MQEAMLAMMFGQVRNTISLHDVVHVDEVS